VPTYTNELQQEGREVSLAIEKLLIAPKDTAWTAGRIYVDSVLPTGFTDLGAVVEDSPALTVARTKFDLRTGIPQVLRFQAVMAVDGRFTISLHSNSQRRVQFAMGNIEPVNMLATTPWPVVTTPAPSDRMSLTLDSSLSLAVGDYIVAETNSSTMSVTENEAKISSISSGTIYFNSPGLPNTPAVDDNVTQLTGIRLPAGTSQLKHYRLLGVADFIDGIQIVHDFQDVVPGGEWTEAIQPGQNGMIALNYDAFGYTSTTYGATSELIVMERFWFPA
jgi:hypothetical protein